MIDVWGEEPETLETEQIYSSDSNTVAGGRRSELFQTRVDDEDDILTQEYGAAKLVVPEEETKLRGYIDQDAVLMEPHELNPERRFVVVPSSEEESDEDVYSGYAKRQRSGYTKRQRRNRRSSGEGFSSSSLQSKGRSRQSSPRRSSYFQLRSIYNYPLSYEIVPRNIPSNSTYQRSSLDGLSSGLADSQETEQSADDLDISAPQVTNLVSDIDSSTGRTADAKPAPKITSAELSAEPKVRAILSSRVVTCTFREVADQIWGSALLTSDLPLIIGLQVHFDSRKQRVLAKVIKEVWQGLLLEDRIDDFDPKLGLPTLAELKNKFLIYVIPGYPHIRLCDELLSLVTWIHPTTSKPFALHTTPSVFNLSEDDFLESSNMVNQAEAIFQHNKKSFMRVHTGSNDKASASPLPAQLWRYGAQMVSTNCHSLDHGRMLNQGMFAGEEGFVLKPPGYRGANTTNSRPEEACVSGVLDLALTIFPAWGLPEAGSNKPSRREIFRFKAEIDTGRQDEIYSKRSTPLETTDPKFGEGFQQVQFSDVTGVIEEFGFIKYDYTSFALPLRSCDSNNIACRILIENPDVLDDYKYWACIRLSRLVPGFRYMYFTHTQKRLQVDRPVFVCITKTFRPYSIATWS